VCQRCAATADSRRRAVFGLTRGGRQPVRPVELKGYLCRILLWRSNRLSKWNELEKRDSWVERNLGRKIWVAVKIKKFKLLNEK
jgi:hypothetical protein